MIGRPPVNVAAAAMATLVVAAAVACARRPARSHVVTIQSFTFAPATLTVATGDTVVWRNSDFVPHTATARDAVWDSQSIAGSDGTWRLVARTPGRHAYYCTFHPNMQGVIEVR